MLRIIQTLTLMLLAVSLCRAPDNLARQIRANEAYTSELVRLITELQKNPWKGWASGSEVVVRYFSDRNPAGTPRGREQPDIVFRVIQADHSFNTIQLYQGKFIQRDFLIKDQVGLDAAWPASFDENPKQTEIKIDGVTDACRIRELISRTIPGGTTVTKEWTLASQPAIVVRKEVIDSNGWQVTSARVRKQIGEKEFRCVEIKKWMRFYYKGGNESITTQYLCPDVPGHVAEQITELFKLVKGQRSSTPFQVEHQKTVELRIP